jgi:ketosteroid isomerase-like protein
LDGELRKLVASPRPSDRRGDLVAVAFHQEAIGAESGAHIEWDQGFVYEIKNGRVTRMWNYLTLADALEAAGLSE